MSKCIEISSLISDDKFKLRFQIFKYFIFIHQSWHLELDLKSLVVDLILDISLDSIKIFIRYGLGGGVRDDVEWRLQRTRIHQCIKLFFSGFGRNHIMSADIAMRKGNGIFSVALQEFWVL